MPYCQPSENNRAYIYSNGTHLVCGGCALGDTDFITTHYSTMLEHVQEHLDAGDRIPSQAYLKMITDQETRGDRMDRRPPDTYVPPELFSGSFTGLGTLTQPQD